MRKKPNCLVCGENSDKVIIDENLRSIPHIMDDKLICGRCTGKGWAFCSECNNAFDTNKVNYDEFYIYNNVSDAPVEFRKFLEFLISEGIKQYNTQLKNFCSNRDYNLNFWEGKILTNINMLEIEEITGLNKFMKPLKRFSDIELSELRKYVDTKIEYIKSKL